MRKSLLFLLSLCAAIDSNYHRVHEEVEEDMFQITVINDIPNMVDLPYPEPNS